MAKESAGTFAERLQKAMSAESSAKYIRLYQRGPNSSEFMVVGVMPMSLQQAHKYSLITGEPEPLCKKRLQSIKNFLVDAPGDYKFSWTADQLTHELNGAAVQRLQDSRTETDDEGEPAIYFFDNGLSYPVSFGDEICYVKAPSYYQRYKVSNSRSDGEFSPDSLIDLAIECCHSDSACTKKAFYETDKKALLDMPASFIRAPLFTILAGPYFAWQLENTPDEGASEL